ncbi:S8 family peptidase [Bernardetia sp.]|uniref:S8 family peptidase n=1 Tax=Bernardetia sp. TaxID=1937974 RepID=UPI0025BD461F|nr:S8 family serine peptidase [Bernardetia sp.]
MENFLYPLAYGGLLLSAAVYFFLKERQHAAGFARNSFFVSGLLYFLSLFFNDGGIMYDLLGVLTPDLAILTVVILIFNRLAPRPKILYFSIFAVIAGLKLFFFDASREAVVNYFTSEDTQVESNEVIIEKVIIGEKEEAVIPSNLSQNGELLLDLNMADKDAIVPVLEKYNLSIRRAFPELQHDEYSELEEYYVVDIPTFQLKNMDAIIGDLKGSGAVDYLENNEILELPNNPTTAFDVTPNKPSFGINDPSVKDLWGFEKMGVAQMYATLKEQKPKKKAKIVILDTGVEADHEDITDNYLSIEKKSDYDKLGHGTHCAGIAAAVTNNGKGIASFSPNSEFVSVSSIKVLNDAGFGSQESVIGGIIKAADQGADVISLSLGGPSNDAHQKAYSEAVKYANKAGAIVVVAAGNSNKNAKDFSPANAEGVITVSAIAPDLSIAPFSNHVQDMKMGIAAPGVKIFSTYPKGTYKFLNGTSMATPYVAGLLGVMKSLNPELDTKAAYEILNSTGKELEAGDKAGNFIQADKAVSAILEDE